MKPMSNLIIGTNVVLMNEPCYALSEQNFNHDGQWKRYQCITVVRNDKLVKLVREMGLKSDYTTDEFLIPGGGVNENGKRWIEHTVVELLWYADSIRNEPFDKTMLIVTDLAKEYQTLQDKKRKKARKGEYIQYGYGN